jgi:excisionase family DNA binding protein
MSNPPSDTPPSWSGEYVSTQQVAVFLGVHIRTVQRYARTGQIKSYSIPGDGYRFKRTDVEEFLRPNHHAPRHDPPPALDPEEGIS